MAEGTESQVLTQSPPAADTDAEDFDNKAPTVPVFDELEPEIPVDVRNPAGKLVRYFVREFERDSGKNNGGGLVQWMKILARRNEMDADGKVVKQNFVGFHEDLIHLCLYDAAGERVPKATIKNWSSKLKGWLFDQCQKVNGLTDKYRKAEGKD